MKRLLLTFVATLSLSLVGGASASATEYTTARDATTAVTSQYLYWERWSPRSCKRCAELWRTPIAGGSNVLVDRVRRGSISALRGGGDVLAYTVTIAGKSYRTSVRAVHDGGLRATLAQATYRPTGRRKCGSQVGAGAVSREGLVAWERVDVSRSENGCDDMPERVSWSAYEGGPGSPTRRLISPREYEPLVLFGSAGYEDALETLNPIAAYEGSWLLAGGIFRTAYLLGTPDGGSIRYAPKATGFLYGPGDLSPSGAVFANFGVNDPDHDEYVEWPALFPQPFDAGRTVDLSAEGFAAPTAHFCGNDLVQLMVGKTRLRLLRRAIDGTIVRSEDFPFRGRSAEAGFECNDDIAVLNYVSWDKRGKRTQQRTFSVALR